MQSFWINNIKSLYSGTVPHRKLQWTYLSIPCFLAAPDPIFVECPWALHSWMIKGMKMAGEKQSNYFLVI